MSHWSNLRGEKVAWSVLGVAITAMVAFVVYSFIGAIVVGIFLYYATRPVDRWLDSRFEHRRVNATVTLLLVGVPMLVVLVYAGLTAVRQVDQVLAMANASDYRSLLQPYVDVASVLTTERLTNVVRNALPRLVGLLGVVFTWSLRIFVAVTVAYYLLRDDEYVASWFRGTFGDEYGAVDFMEGVDDDLTTIYTGNLITIALTGVIAVVVYYALDTVAPSGTGVAFPLLLGLVTGVATLVPAVGIKLIYFPYTAYLLWQAVRGGTSPLWFPVAFFLVTLVVVDSIPDVFIRSYVSKGSINMGLMLLTYVLGAVAFGWYGVFFAPILLVAFLHFARNVLPNVLEDRPGELVTE